MSDLAAEVAEEQARPLPDEGLARLVDELWPGGELLVVERIVGGLGAGMHRLDVRDAGGSADAVVVRTFLAAWGHGPPPDVVALARALAAVHTLRAAGVPHLPPAPDLAHQVERSMPLAERVTEGFVDVSPLWGALDAWVADAEPAAAVLVHGDYHPGNVLSDGDRVTVVDWTWACLGDPGRDLGYCRYDLTLANGPEVAEGFTDAYLDAGGPARPSPGWDLVAVASSLPTPAGWLRGFHELGRVDLDAALFEARGRVFLQAALAAS